jgi:putative effector of murein hydrolase
MLYEILVFYCLAAIIVYASAMLLNKKFFKTHPISKLKAVSISFIAFLILTAYFTAVTYLRYSTLGLPVKDPLDLSGISFAIFFYWMLVKVKTKFDIVTEKGGFVTSFATEEEAEDYLVKNSDKKYKIK